MVNTKLCENGKNQSPINIKTNNTKKCEINCNLMFYYRPSRFLMKNINNNLLIDYDNTDINTLPDTYFRDYKNTGSSNLKYILQAELVQKFMGTDMYFISSRVIINTILRDYKYKFN